MGGNNRNFALGGRPLVGSSSAAPAPGQPMTAGFLGTAITRAVMAGGLKKKTPVVGPRRQSDAVAAAGRAAARTRRGGTALGGDY